MRISSRASAAPRHVWIPWPNPTFSFSGRSTSKRSDRRRRARRGSRRPVISSTGSSAGIVTPCHSVSTVLHRPWYCDGAQKRRISSTARERAARRSSMHLPPLLRVPGEEHDATADELRDRLAPGAGERAAQKPATSSSREADLAEPRDHVVGRVPPLLRAPARGCRCPRLRPASMPCLRSASGSPARGAASRRSSAGSAGGPPRARRGSREITSTGNGPEKSAMRSNISSPSSGSRYLRTRPRIIGSRSATAFGVNTRLTSCRIRSWSGGSMKMIEPVAAEQRRMSGIGEHVDRDALRARERLPVAVRGDDVVVARQRPEAVVLVAVHRAPRRAAAGRRRTDR